MYYTNASIVNKEHSGELGKTLIFSQGYNNNISQMLPLKLFTEVLSKVKASGSVEG